MQSLERGARVAETGTLVPRARRESAAGGAKEAATGDSLVTSATERLATAVISS